MRLGTRKTDRIGETLAERAGGDLNARSIVCFRVAGSDAVHMTEVLQVVDADAVAEHVEDSILQHTAVTVAAGPLSVLSQSCFYRLSPAMVS